MNERNTLSMPNIQPAAQDTPLMAHIPAMIAKRILPLAISFIFSNKLSF